MAAKRGTLVPPQHGAWGFLALPVALGIAAGGWTWAAAPVVLAWVALYPWSWALTNRLAAPRPERFARPLVIYFSLRRPSTTDVQQASDDRLGHDRELTARLAGFARWKRIFHVVH